MWHLYQYLTTIWLLVALCLPLVCVRLYIQISTKVQPWREGLLAYAYLMLVVDAVLTTIVLVREVDVEHASQLSDREQIWLLKLNYADTFTWPLGCVACRILLLLMYNDLCPRHLFPKTRWLIAFAWFFVVGGAIAVNLIYQFLICYPNPLREFWLPGGECAGYWGAFFATLMLLTFSDILGAISPLFLPLPICFSSARVYIIPLIIIFQLQNLTKVQKFGSAAMFAVGFLNVGSAVLIFVAEILPLSGYFIDPLALASIKTYAISFQLPTALIVLCIPQMRVIGRLAKIYVYKLRSPKQLFNSPQMIDATTGGAAGGTNPQTDLEGGSLLIKREMSACTASQQEIIAIEARERH